MTHRQTNKQALDALIHKIIAEQSFDDLILMLETIADERAETLHNGRWKTLAIALSHASKVQR